MISPEQLISDLLNEITKLKEELDQAKQDILDFERAALIWKKSYGQTEAKLRIKLENAEQTIEELQEDLNDEKRRQSKE
jgi:predicted  nucleic acid-binding Zn-ribbon protein